MTELSHVEVEVLAVWDGYTYLRNIYRPSVSLLRKLITTGGTNYTYSNKTVFKTALVQSNIADLNRVAKRILKQILLLFVILCFLLKQFKISVTHQS